MPPRPNNQKLKSQLRDTWYNPKFIQYARTLIPHQSLLQRARKPKIIIVIIMRKRNSVLLLEKVAKVLLNRQLRKNNQKLGYNGREHA